MVFLLVGLLLTPLSAAADSGNWPPPVGPKTNQPKPHASSIGDTSQSVDATGKWLTTIGGITSQPKQRRLPGDVDGPIVNAAWSVSLVSSNYNPNVNQGFTLTASTNQNVGPTPYYIQIYLGSTRYASCGSGTTCSVTLSSSQAGASYLFQARVAASDGSAAQAWSNTVTVRITAPWSVSLSSSTTTPNVNEGFTLTARASQDVGPTPYYIQIYLGSTRYASCGSGTMCSVTLYGPQAGASYTFQSRISASDGTSVQAWSNTVTVNVQNQPISSRLNVPFLTQVGSAGVPGVGSNNCGPASVAMTIRYFGGSLTVQDAAIAIRGSNTASNGGTDFKSSRTTQLLAQYRLSPNTVSTFDDMKRQLALGRPVIILVNNNTYRYNSPAPYVNNSNGWFVPNHIVVVTGYDTSYIYINDPLRYSASNLPNPANYTLPIATFKNAASTTPQSNTNTWYAISVSR